MKNIKQQKKLNKKTKKNKLKVKERQKLNAIINSINWVAIAAFFIGILSIKTPKSGPIIIDGTKFMKAIKPTKVADDVSSQAIQPIVILCIQSALRENIFPAT